MNAATELAMMEWQEGLDRLEHLHAGRKREAVYRHVVDEIIAELTRRVGQT